MIPTLHIEDHTIDSPNKRRSPESISSPVNVTTSCNINSPNKRRSPESISNPVNVTTSCNHPCCKTVRRRGNIYNINESTRDIAKDDIDTMIHDLYEETLKMSSVANSSAVMYKYIIIISTFILIIAGAVIGALTLETHNNQISRYITAGLGFLITIIKTLVSTFTVEKRAVLLKEISSRLRKLSRQIRSLETAEIKYKKKRALLEEYYIEVDELDLGMFDNSLTTSSVSRASNLASLNRLNPSYIDDKHSETTSQESPQSIGERLSNRFFGKSKRANEPVTPKDDIQVPYSPPSVSTLNPPINRQRSSSDYPRESKEADVLDQMTEVIVQ